MEAKPWKSHFQCYTVEVSYVETACSFALWDKSSVETGNVSSVKPVKATIDTNWWLLFSQKHSYTHTPSHNSFLQHIWPHCDTLTSLDLYMHLTSAYSYSHCFRHRKRIDLIPKLETINDGIKTPSRLTTLFRLYFWQNILRGDLFG